MLANHSSQPWGCLGVWVVPLKGGVVGGRSWLPLSVPPPHTLLRGYARHTAPSSTITRPRSHGFHRRNSPTIKRDRGIGREGHSHKATAAMPPSLPPSHASKKARENFFLMRPTSTVPRFLELSSSENRNVIPSNHQNREEKKNQDVLCTHTSLPTISSSSLLPLRACPTPSEF